MRQRTLWVIAAGIALGLVQAALMGHLSILHAGANIVIGALVLWSFLTTNRSLVWYGMVPAGLILDLFSPLQFGFITLELCVIALLLHEIDKRFIHYASVPIIVLSSFVAMIVYDLIGVVGAGLFGQVPVWLIFGDAAYTALVCLAILIGLLLFERNLLGTDGLALKERGRS